MGRPNAEVLEHHAELPMQVVQDMLQTSPSERCMRRVEPQGDKLRPKSRTSWLGCSPHESVLSQRNDDSDVT